MYGVCVADGSDKSMMSRFVISSSKIDVSPASMCPPSKSILVKGIMSSTLCPLHAVFEYGHEGSKVLLASRKYEKIFSGTECTGQKIGSLTAP